MAITNFTSSELTAYITSTEENLNLETLFGASKYQSSIRKRVVVEEGVIIGATSTANYALNMPSGFGGRLVLVNKGSIQGAGGAGNGGTGGNAIFAGAPNILIDNRGSIYSGGGGGGKGGTGGTGGSGNYSSGYSCNYSCCVQNCPFPAWMGICIPGTNPPCFQMGSCCCTTCYTTVSTSGGGGGAGGNGGIGRGYNAALAAGLAGVSGSGGGINSGGGGTGGTGGSGGDFGSSGSAGSSGFGGGNGNVTAGLAGLAGLSAGLAGYYVVNNSNITWISNGTLAGRVV